MVPFTTLTRGLPYLIYGKIMLMTMTIMMIRNMKTRTRRHLISEFSVLQNWTAVCERIRCKMLQIYITLNRQIQRNGSKKKKEKNSGRHSFILFCCIFLFLSWRCVIVVPCKSIFFNHKRTQYWVKSCTVKSKINKFIRLTVLLFSNYSGASI